MPGIRGFCVVFLCAFAFHVGAQVTVTLGDGNTDDALVSEIVQASALYPQVSGLKVLVKHASIKTTLTCRPRMLSALLNRRAKRSYIITINNNVGTNGLCYDSIPSPARRGLWAHELAHVADYNGVGVIGLLIRAYRYTGKRTKERFEKSIDMLCINHGAGHELWQWSIWVIEASPAPDWYKSYKKQFYLEPHEILDLMNYSQEH